MLDSVVTPAIADVRKETLRRLRSVLSQRDLDGAARCSERLSQLLDTASGQRTVLVAYGGGKDSSYMLAFVRTMQLLLHEAGDVGFRLRSVTNRHAGMPRAVMENIDRAYQALGLPGDPACELLLVDGDEVKPFDVDLPQHPDVVARNRVDILMTGHRTCADARPTFCNACNLSMINAFGLAAGDRVDVVITGDSPREQRDYRLWVNRLGQTHGLLPPRSELSGFKGFLTTADNIARAYFTDIHGSADPQALAGRRIATEVRDDLRFFSVYDDTAYRSGAHWPLLTDLLGFVFDDLAFSFSESDCGNPALMAHLRGLKCERLYDRSYGEGLAEYAEFALRIMERKEFPQSLIDIMRRRYQEPDADTRLRRIVGEYAEQCFDLTETQLVCMVYSPFLQRGAGLDRYLARELPRLRSRLPEIHRLLSGTTDGATDDTDGGDLPAVLAGISGLDVARLRTLYAATASGRGDLLGSILAGDPHKDQIKTRHSPVGPVVTEQISGR